MEGLRSKMVDACIEKRKQGMDFSQIRKELENAGIEGSNIKEVISLVDIYERAEIAQKVISTQKKRLKVEGAMYLVIGAATFLFGITLAILTSKSSFAIIYYGGIAGGLSMMGYGLNCFKKKSKI